MATAAPAPAAATTAPTPSIQRQSSSRRTPVLPIPAGWTCRAVDRSADDTFGATVTVTTSATFGATVVSPASRRVLDPGRGPFPGALNGVLDAGRRPLHGLLSALAGGLGRCRSRALRDRDGLRGGVSGTILRARAERNCRLGGAVGLVIKGHNEPPERDPVITDFPPWLGSTIARYRYGDGRRIFTPTKCPADRLAGSGVNRMTDTLTATLRTNQGTVVVRLFPDHAPKTVRNFVELAEGGRQWTDPGTGQATTGRLYDGTIFHRVIPDFMIQGGDPLGTGRGGPGYKFGDEIHPDLAFDRPYLLAMANAGPGTNGSQFFVTTVPTPWLNGKHTIFGEVIDGADVVDRISRLKTASQDRPVEDVILESVTVERGTSTP